MTDNIILHEVGPRDGIQVEKKNCPYRNKNTMDSKIMGKWNHYDSNWLLCTCRQSS